MSDAPVQTGYTFLYQSYFDNTLLEAAVLAQGGGSLIVDTATAPAKNEDISGYGVGLEPSSETPVAISFRRAGQNSSVLILRPGQYIYPFGRTEADKFEGFRWGLPYGWLGGGRASLVVLRSPRAELSWFGRPQILFHRQTMKVQASTYDLTAAVNAGTIFPNWPLRFPSLGLRRTSAGGVVSQSGTPMLTVEPSLTAIRLGVTGITNSPTIRFLFFETKELDLNSVGVVVATPITFKDVSFPTYSAAGVNGPSQSPIEFQNDGIMATLGIDPPLTALTGIGVVPISLGNGDNIDNTYIQVLRYGRL